MFTREFLIGLLKAAGTAAFFAAFKHLAAAFGSIEPPASYSAPAEKPEH